MSQNGRDELRTPSPETDEPLFFFFTSKRFGARDPLVWEGPSEIKLINGLRDRKSCTLLYVHVHVIIMKGLFFSVTLDFLHDLRLGQDV